MTRFHGDRALAGDGDDKLGFRPTAERIAATLAAKAPPDGLVIGITGRWGSGKSSLINLTRDALRRLPPGERPYVVDFKPWLVGGRDALLQNLFAELVAGIDQIELEEGDATGVTVRKAERASTALREFAGLLGGASKILKAGEGWVPWLANVRWILEGASQLVFSGRQRSLTESKRKVCERLAKIKRALVVVIDDVDRLDPAEVIEVLRLVRSVADFPNITYVLLYDPDVVSEAVCAVSQVKDGHAYVEKIVQINVPVPLPEAFDLRRWFERELWAMNLPVTDEIALRLADIIDHEGSRYLHSPRTVVRTLDSIRLYWTALKGSIDLSDFVWLQFVKVGNPTLYHWIESYLIEISVLVSGRIVISDEEKSKARNSLDAALLIEGMTFSRMCDRLADYLPGISVYHQDRDGGIYLEVDQPDVDKAIAACRLASPDHFRLYFAFAQPVNAPRTSDFTELFEAVRQSAERTQDLLKQWNSEHLTSRVTRAEIILDRLSVKELFPLTSSEADNLLIAYANSMDELAEQNVSRFKEPDVWRRAMRSLPVLFGSLNEKRQDVVRRMFSEGRSLSWLTSIFRHEIFAHGRYGSRPSSDKLTSPDELDIITEAMLGRYRNMSFRDFAERRKPLSLLFAWLQAGDENGPRDLLAKEIETDEGLVYVLEHLCGSVVVSQSRSTREIITLNRSNLSFFIDYDVSRSRIVEIAGSSAELSLKSRAKRLLERFQDGDRY